MATAVQEFSTVLMMSDPTLLSEQEAKLKIQNSYLSLNITKSLLRAANLNGLQGPESRFTHEVINDPGFKDAVSTLDKTCHLMREGREDEMGALVGTLDITDAHLCVTYKTVSDHLMMEEIRFGRIASLFFFTYMLAKRLHLEGRQREVKSVVNWLGDFLNESISPWLIKHHGGNWAAIKGAIKLDPLPKQSALVKSPPGGGSGWMAMAALGVGAFVVGALSFKS